MTAQQKARERILALIMRNAEPPQELSQHIDTILSEYWHEAFKEAADFLKEFLKP